MARKYAKGSRALGICARSGREMLLNEMIFDGVYPNLRVDPAWYEPKHPLEYLSKVDDPIALWRPAPESYLDTAPVLLMAQSGDKINFSWTAADFDADMVRTYKLYVSTDGGLTYSLAVTRTNVYDYLGGLTTQTLTYNNTYLASIGTFYAFVVAGNGGTRSIASAIVQLTITSIINLGFAKIVIDGFQGGAASLKTTPAAYSLAALNGQTGTAANNGNFDRSEMGGVGATVCQVGKMVAALNDGINFYNGTIWDFNFVVRGGTFTFHYPGIQKLIAGNYWVGGEVSKANSVYWIGKVKSFAASATPMTATNMDLYEFTLPGLLYHVMPDFMIAAGGNYLCCTTNSSSFDGSPAGKETKIFNLGVPPFSSLALTATLPANSGVPSLGLSGSQYLCITGLKIFRSSDGLTWDSGATSPWVADWPTYAAGIAIPKYWVMGLDTYTMAGGQRLVVVWVRGNYQGGNGGLASVQPTLTLGQNYCYYSLDDGATWSTMQVQHSPALGCSVYDFKACKVGILGCGFDYKAAGTGRYGFVLHWPGGGQPTQYYAGVDTPSGVFDYAWHNISVDRDFIP